MPKKAQVQIEMGKGGDILSPFSRLTITQQMGWHHSFKLQIPSRAIEEKEGTLIEKSKDFIGKLLRVTIKTHLKSQKSAPNEFRGIVTDISLVRQHGKGIDIVFSGYSPTILLDDGKGCKSFSEKAISATVKEILGEYPQNLLEFDVSPRFTKPVPYLVQYQESNFHFISRIAATYGEWFYYDGAKLCFGKRKSEKPIKLHLGKELFQLDFGIKLTPASFDRIAYNYEKNETFRVSAASQKPEGLEPKYGSFLLDESNTLYKQTPVSPLRLPIQEKGELEEAIMREKTYKSNEMVGVSGISDHIGLTVGKSIELTGLNEKKATENFGKYVITHISHLIDGDGNYQNHFQAMPNEAVLPLQNPHVLPPQCEPQLGTVKENHDPDGLGRAKVQLQWQEKGETTPWIRVVSGHGGKSGGFFIMPEIEDEVMIGFEYNDPDRPFIMGSAYHGKAKPSDSWADGDNNIKAIKTKSGNEITLKDTAGEEEISILNKAGENKITMTIGEGGLVTIHSMNKLVITSKEMTVDASDSFTLNSPEIKVNGKNITVSAEEALKASAKDATVDGQSSIKLSVQQSTIELSPAEGKLNSTNTTVEAKANMAVKGGAMTTVEAPMVKLN